MNMPGFDAEASLRRSENACSNGFGALLGAQFGSGQSARLNAGKVVPAIPACRNCDWILDRCESNGWRPAGLCNLCAVGHCY